MHSRYWFALVATAIGSASSAAQQPAEVIRGRITDDSSKALVAAVMVTRGPDRLTQQATSDSTGNYRVRFEQGTGDYLVYVSVPGFKASRRRVQRQAGEHEFVVDFKLERDVALLAAVKVTADKPERASNTVQPTDPEPGSNDKWKDGINGAIAPGAAGDLNAIAGTMSNVTMTGAGPSILGSGAESNLNTLNGMALAGGSIPRAARTETRVTGATFDPTRGGFAGANIDVRLGPGDRFYQNRNAFLTLDPRQLQYADATARALGAQSGGARGSFGADGEMIRSAATFMRSTIELRQSSFCELDDAIPSRTASTSTGWAGAALAVVAPAAADAYAPAAGASEATAALTCASDARASWPMIFAMMLLNTPGLCSGGSIRSFGLAPRMARSALNAGSSTRTTGASSVERLPSVACIPTPHWAPCMGAVPFVSSRRARSPARRSKRCSMPPSPHRITA